VVSQMGGVPLGSSLAFLNWEAGNPTLNKENPMSRLLWQPTQDGFRGGANGQVDAPSHGEVSDQHPFPTQLYVFNDDVNEFIPVDATQGMPVAMVGAVAVQSKTVFCPLIPVAVPGIVSANALDALDAVGEVFSIRVPRSGIIHGARWFDLSDNNSAINVHVFNSLFIMAASDAAWSPSDSDIPRIVKTLVFSTNVDQINSRVHELDNLAVGYSAPEGVLYCGAATPGGSTPTYTAPAFPQFQLTILSDDPFFMEG